MEESQITPNANKPTSGLASSALLIWDFVKVIIIALVIVVPIRYFIFQPFEVSGSSMEPNFEDHQYLIIDEISYKFTEPMRGDVLVLRYPVDRSQFFIKRIIGLPGEKIKIEEGRVVIFNADNPNGFQLDETYLPSQGLTYPHNPSIIGGQKALTLKDSEYFMMGDNRLASSDSRDWGPLDEKDIVGKVFLRALPLTEFKVYTETPSYNQ